MEDIESQDISCETEAEAGGSCSDASTSPELQGESKVELTKKMTASHRTSWPGVDS